jgi:hypothetical protein
VQLSKQSFERTLAYTSDDILTRILKNNAFLPVLSLRRGGISLDLPLSTIGSVFNLLVELPLFVWLHDVEEFLHECDTEVHWDGILDGLQFGCNFIVSIRFGHIGLLEKDIALECEHFRMDSDHVLLIHSELLSEPQISAKSRIGRHSSGLIFWNKKKEPPILKADLKLLFRKFSIFRFHALYHSLLWRAHDHKQRNSPRGPQRLLPRTS